MAGSADRVGKLDERGQLRAGGVDQPVIQRPAGGQQRQGEDVSKFLLSVRRQLSDPSRVLDVGCAGHRPVKSSSTLGRGDVPTACELGSGLTATFSVRGRCVGRIAARTPRAIDAQPRRRASPSHRRRDGRIKLAGDNSSLATATSRVRIGLVSVQVRCPLLWYGDLQGRAPE